jgi:hypothetical protein
MQGTRLVQLPNIPGVVLPATQPIQANMGQNGDVTRTNIPTIPTNIGTQNQYIRELELAPLSPRSPRVMKPTSPVVVTHPVQQGATETCCICYDTEIPTNNLLGCQHPVCSECIGQLRAPECPMCKKFIEGPLVTGELLAEILNRQEQAKMEEETANYLAGLYLQENPEANPEEVYARYRGH